MPVLMRADRRSGARRRQATADRFDALAVDAEVAPPETGCGAHMDDRRLLVDEKLDVVDKAHQPAGELRVKIARLLFADDAHALHAAEHGLQRRPRGGGRPAESQRLDVVNAITRLRLAAHAVRSTLGRSKPAVTDAQARRPLSSEESHRRALYSSPTAALPGTTRSHPSTRARSKCCRGP